MGRPNLDVDPSGPFGYKFTTVEAPPHAAGLFRLKAGGVKSPARVWKWRARPSRSCPFGAGEPPFPKRATEGSERHSTRGRAAV